MEVQNPIQWEKGMCKLFKKLMLIKHVLNGTYIINLIFKEADIYE